jgi:putative MATE family efflux protein
MSKAQTVTDPTKPYANKGNLTEGDVTKHLIRLSVPMIWGIFAIISFQLVDTFYISLLGTEPLAAITFTFPVTFIMFSMTLGMGIAMSSVLSRQIGQGDMDTVKRIASHGIIMAFIFGIFLAIVGFLFMDPIFKAMGADETMMPIIYDYMSIWFAGSIFITVPLVGNSAIRASGDSFVPAVIMTTVAVVNIILDPILIFGLLGFPRLEVQGAAIATVLANACSMGAGLYVLYARKKLICMESLLHRWHLFGDSVKRLAVIAIPAGLTSSIQPLTNAVIIALLAGYSAEAVAAYGVVTRIEAFAFTTIMALATGMAPIIGQNWGAKKFDRVNETLKRAFTFAALWSLLIAVIFMAFGKHIVSPFADDHATEIISVAVLYFWVVSLSYIPGNLVAGWGSAFNAMGMPKRSFGMVIIKLVLINIPLAIIGSHYFGIIGIFGSIAITNILTGVVFHVLNMRICHTHEQRPAAAE